MDIRYDIPIPEAKKYPLDKMRVGGSVFIHIPKDADRRAYAKVINGHATYQLGSGNFKCRLRRENETGGEDPNGRLGVRVWRTG